MIKLFLISDMTLTRSSLRALLENCEQVEVVGEATYGSDTIQLVAKLDPEVILIDLQKPGSNCVEATRHIHTAHPHVRIIGLSLTATDGQRMFDGLRAGATGYISANATFAELLTAIQTVIAGGTYLSPSLNNAAVADYLRMAQGIQNLNGLGKLSIREREVLKLIAEGLWSRAIAQRLYISTRTVDTHRHNIMKKLDIHSIAGLTKFAVHHGLSPL